MKNKSKEFIVKPLKNKKATIISAFPNLFTNPFSNIAIIGSKMSGKTTLVYNILREVCKKGMNVTIYAPTIYSDDAYEDVIDLMKKKKVHLELHTHFIDPETGENHVKHLVDGIDYYNKQLKQEHNPELNDDLKPVIPPPNMDWLYKIANCTPCSKPQIQAEEIPKPKKLTAKQLKKENTDVRPDTVLLFDDLSSDLTKYRILYQCMIANRHRKLMVIIASHSCIDLEPSSYNQLDYLVLYPRLPHDKILTMNNKVGLSASEDTNRKNTLLEKYVEATTKGDSVYDFLLVNKKDNSFRRNFNVPL